MQYEGDAYHPPSEARNLTTQVAIGCSHNKCTFCHMYMDKQLHVRKQEEILADLDECRDTYGPYAQRVFFADGDVLVVKTEPLLELLHYVKKNFPYAEHTTSYGMAKDVLRESEEELAVLRKTGLVMIYFGAESGDDEILVHIQKGEMAKEIIAAGQKLKCCGTQTSVTLISGLGGSAGMEAHAVEPVGLIDAANPEYASILTSHLSSESPMAKEIQWSKTEFLKSDQIMDEMELLLMHTDLPGTVFRTSRVSNYLALAGTFNQDLPRLLREMREVREHSRYRMESWRRRL